MKRFLWGSTALCLMCFLSIPALAAGTPNWDGPLGKEAGPHLCKTGKGRMSCTMMRPAPCTAPPMGGMDRAEPAVGGGERALQYRPEWSGEKGI